MTAAEEFDESLYMADLSVNFIDEFSYLGFNVEYTHKRMMDIERNTDQLKKDIITILSITLVRGTKMKKATDKMPDAGKKIALALQKKYGIKDVKPTSRDDITAGRLLACYPKAASKILRDNTTIRTLSNHDDLPRDLQFFGANALISKTHRYYAMYIEWARSAALVIKSKPADVEQFAEIVYASYYGKKEYV